MDPITILSRTILFSGLSENQIQTIFHAGKILIYEKGDIVFEEDKDARHLLILIDGRIKIFKVSFEGKEQILHMVEPGEPFGEVPLFIRGTLPAYAMAMTKSSVFQLSKEAFLSTIENNPEVAMHIIGILCIRLRQFARLVEELSLKEVPGRLATYLLYLYEKNSKKEKFELDITKNQLASLLGTVPETLSRAFSKLKSLGVIDLDGSKVHIIDPEFLVEISVEGLK